MTIQAEIEKIESEYMVKDGIICSPGKFQNEKIATVYFYDNLLSGMADNNDCMELTDEEKKLFDIPTHNKYVFIWVDSVGFINAVYFTKYEYDVFCSENEEEQEID